MCMKPCFVLVVLWFIWVGVWFLLQLLVMVRRFVTTDLLAALRGCFLCIQSSQYKSLNETLRQ